MDHVFHCKIKKTPLINDYFLSHRHIHDNLYLFTYTSMGRESLINSVLKILPKLVYFFTHATFRLLGQQSIITLTNVYLVFSFLNMLKIIMLI